MYKRFWENTPEEEKGLGTIRRRPPPKGWMEDLTSDQIKIVEQEAAQILKDYYHRDCYVTPK